MQNSSAAPSPCAPPCDATPFLRPLVRLMVLASSSLRCTPSAPCPAQRAHTRVDSGGLVEIHPPIYQRYQLQKWWVHSEDGRAGWEARTGGTGRPTGGGGHATRRTWDGRSKVETARLAVAQRGPVLHPRSSWSWSKVSPSEWNRSLSTSCEIHRGLEEIATTPSCPAASIQPGPHHGLPWTGTLTLPLCRPIRLTSPPPSTR